MVLFEEFYKQPYLTIQPVILTILVVSVDHLDKILLLLGNRELIKGIDIKLLEYFVVVVNKLKASKFKESKRG